MRLLSLFAAIAAMLVASVAVADQHRFQQYSTSFRKVYWGELYPRAGSEFYCGKHYNAPVNGATPEGMSLEHAYAAQWIVLAMGCGANREECRANNPDFGFREADMHNLFPAWGRANSSRGNRPFGMIPGENRTFAGCDFENESGIVEPRPIARGNFARAIFYMHVEYGLPIDETMLPILIKWNTQDPVNQTERRRNDKIEELQGTRNPFIDDANLVRRTFPEQFQ